MTEKTRAYIGIGANLGDPVKAVQEALQALAALPESRLLAVSRLYRTPAWGRIDQPDFINAAAVLETTLTPQALLAALQAIELKAGRDRRSETAARRWGPRVLDLDLLLYGEQVINEPGLRVPHPYLHERAFALVPLAEIAPEAPFPGHGSVGEALRLVDPAGIEPIDAVP
ncbi:2-amino-4-hydroxy-6-hydroxymethyldihydropteridine diphosphokinase [Thermomonas hydrothermalis]|uniref:2-amino-4-hydroxy-6-hydroxymethyldihydropteridine pyrophosphokinase n=1 Tax=Thermomonas hydrothermalis TaxID=213588 RepID=A0A1M4T402_9GAMM|nr:2-amino-4-hydroxy-6-hydroxymethyldihydropteridine diphosphokinase [Thermomonas hydrothermalis]SHE39262.1 2-amino-4-hydroxy-6-hydroxymethyldihydropteridinediphosphokinase [Thermomonas hydrothermalis]